MCIPFENRFICSLLVGTYFNFLIEKMFGSTRGKFYFGTFKFRKLNNTKKQTFYYIKYIMYININTTVLWETEKRSFDHYIIIVAASTPQQYYTHVLNSDDVENL